MATDEPNDPLWDLLNRKEDLHPDLKARHRADTVLPMIHHPLVLTHYFGDMENARLNAMLAHKQGAVAAALEKKDWRRYVFLHERPYRLDALFDLLDLGLDQDPKAYWPLVADVWIDSENIYENYDLWQDLWGANVPKRYLVMSPEDRSALSSMPDSIPVYRGVGSRYGAEGMAWSIDFEKAKWFAKRWSANTPFVASGTIRKKNVLAYFTGREESEIVAFPDAVQGLKISSV